MNVVYRKMQNGKEFMKIIDRSEALSIWNSEYPSRSLWSHRIICTNNSVTIEGYFDDHVSIPSSQEEFEAAYKVAVDAMANAYVGFLKNV